MSPLSPDLAAHAITQALWLLPGAMTSDQAYHLLFAIGMQESGFKHRRQQPSGPARGAWQFERSGVQGVFTHPASRFWLSAFCSARGCFFSVAEIYKHLELDDVLAAGVARLLIFTDSQTLPRTEKAAWECYLRLWRPGKPRPDSWPANWQFALSYSQ